MKRAQVVVSDESDSVPVPEPQKPPPSAMWMILKGIAVGNSILVNRSAGYVRTLLGQLPDRETDPEERRSVRARRYKVKQVDDDNTRIWRLK